MALPDLTLCRSLPVLSSPTQRPSVTTGCVDRKPFARLVAVVSVALFTTLVMHRVTPERLTAGEAPLHHVMADGTVLTLRPGSAVNVVRDFSLWGGTGARPRLVRWLRGSGQVTLSPEAMPFYVVTPDAEMNVSEGTVDIDVSSGRGTRIRTIGGRPSVTVRGHDEVGGLMASRGAPTTVEPGEVLEVRNGAFTVNEDVAGEDTIVRPGMPSGG